MAVRFRADGSIGRAAIYEASDDAPWASPRSYLSRVHFHSDLDYVAFSSATPAINTSVTVSGSFGGYDRVHNIGAHGKSGVPFAFARCYVNGRWLPLAGTVPVVTFVSTAESNMVCFTLGIDAAYVYIAESRSFDGAGSFGDVSVPVQVYLSETLA